MSDTKKAYGKIPSILEENVKQDFWLQLGDVELLSWDMQHTLHRAFDLFPQEVLVKLMDRALDLAEAAKVEVAQEILWKARYAIERENLNPEEVVRGIEREYRLKRSLQRSKWRGKKSKVRDILYFYRGFLQDTFPDKDTQEISLIHLQNRVRMELSSSSQYRLRQALKEANLPLEPLFEGGKLLKRGEI